MRYGLFNDGRFLVDLKTSLSAAVAEQALRENNGGNFEVYDFFKREAVVDYRLGPKPNISASRQLLCDAPARRTVEQLRTMIEAREEI